MIENECKVWHLWVSYIYFLSKNFFMKKLTWAFFIVRWRFISFFFFFSIWVFFHENSRFTGQQGKGEGIYLTPLYHFHQLHGHLGISRAITARKSLTTKLRALSLIGTYSTGNNVNKQRTNFIRRFWIISSVHTSQDFWKY